MDDNCVLVITEVINMIATFGAAIIGGLITGVFILVAAIIAYKGGLHTYFKRREHEQIMKRYLDEGVDRVLAAVDHATIVSLPNYTKAFRTLTLFEFQTKEENLSDEFQRFDIHYLELTPYYKIERLVGDNIFGRVILMLFGFVSAESDFLNGEFKSSLEHIYLEKVNGKLILKKMKKHMDESYKEFNTYALLSEELQKIASILEKETNLNWANLAKFKDRPEVKASVKRLKERFGPKLQEQRQKQEQNNK